MEKNKNNKYLYFIIVVLILVVITLSGYVIVNKVLEKKHRQDIKIDSNENIILNEKEFLGTYRNSDHKGMEFTLKEGNKADINNLSCTNRLPLKDVSYKYANENNELILYIDVNNDDTYQGIFIGTEDNGYYKFKAKSSNCAAEENTFYIKDIIISKKLIDVSNCSNSKTTFNNISVDLKQVDNDGVCTIKEFAINGKDIKGDVSLWINSYEIYDNNVIIMSGDTSGNGLFIYNVSSNSIIRKLNPDNLNGYWPKAYSSSDMGTDNGIVIKGFYCGEQCGYNESKYRRALFEMKYVNGKFSDPRLIEELEKIISSIEYNIDSNSNNVISNAISISEGEEKKFDYCNNESLILKNGIPTIVKANKKVFSKITNVKEIYLVDGDYNHEYAFLTNDGDIYVGDTFVMYNGNIDEAHPYVLDDEVEFNDIEKVESQNKYVDVKLLEVVNNPNWKSEDVHEYYFVGITKEGTKDLIKFNY